MSDNSANTRGETAGQRLKDVIVTTGKGLWNKRFDYGIFSALFVALAIICTFARLSWHIEWLTGIEHCFYSVPVAIVLYEGLVRNQVGIEVRDELRPIIDKSIERAEKIVQQTQTVAVACAELGIRGVYGDFREVNSDFTLKKLLPRCRRDDEVICLARSLFNLTKDCGTEMAKAVEAGVRIRLFMLSPDSPKETLEANGVNQGELRASEERLIKLCDGLRDKSVLGYLGVKYHEEYLPDTLLVVELKDSSNGQKQRDRIVSVSQSFTENRKRVFVCVGGPGALANDLYGRLPLFGKLCSEIKMEVGSLPPERDDWWMDASSGVAAISGTRSTPAPIAN